MQRGWPLVEPLIGEMDAECGMVFEYMLRTAEAHAQDPQALANVIEVEREVARINLMRSGMDPRIADLTVPIGVPEALLASL